MSNHGYIVSCLGPVVDIQLAADVYREDRSIHSRLREGVLETETTGQKTTYIARQIFYPTVYDSITIVRPSVLLLQLFLSHMSLDRTTQQVQ
jgi:hypothetical protein